MRYITLAIAFLICTAADAQIIRAEPFYVAPEEGVTLLLDAYPGAAVAYSLRKLDKDYTGSAIRVRRSSDNTEQDIGFVNNYLDTAAMKTFVGANNGFVVTWYNQADSAGVFGVRNATQATAANQAQIIASGTLYYTNSMAAVRFNGTSMFLNVNHLGIFNNVNKADVYAVNSTDNATNENRILFAASIGTAVNNRYVMQKEAAGFRVGGRRLDADNFADAIAVNYAGQRISNGFYDYENSNIYIYLNGSVAASNLSANTDGFTSATNSQTVRIAATNNQPPISFWLGTIQEIVIYNTNKDSDRTNITSAINSFYSIY